MQRKEIIFVTGNENKLQEVKMILATGPDSTSDVPFELVNQPLDLDEIQEIDLEAIALHKCKQAVQMVGPGKPVFVEDTALRFDSFNGLPGAYIKWFVQSLGLAKIVKLLDPYQDKGAEAVTTIVYADENGHYNTFQGVTKGLIVESRGSTAFGWDSIFEPLESGGKTYAEMEKEKKNLISQRGKAFAKLKNHLYNN